MVQAKSRNQTDSPGWKMRLIFSHSGDYFDKGWWIQEFKSAVGADRGDVDIGKDYPSYEFHQPRQR